MRTYQLLPLISLGFALVHSNAFAVEDQTVMIFNLEEGMYATVDNPTCQRSLNISRLLDSDAFKAIAANSGPTAALILGTTQSVLDAVQNHGGSIAGLINDFNGGSWSLCETACVVLPSGASIKEIRISSRVGLERVSYLASGSNPHDPNSPNILKYGGVLNAGSMGDFSGYQGLQFNPKSHSVCTTAKNWSGDQPTSQTVRVIFER